MKRALLALGAVAVLGLLSLPYLVYRNLEPSGAPSGTDSAQPARSEIDRQQSAPPLPSARGAARDAAKRADPTEAKATLAENAKSSRGDRLADRRNARERTARDRRSDADEARRRSARSAPYADLAALEGRSPHRPDPTSDSREDAVEGPDAEGRRAPVDPRFLSGSGSSGAEPDSGEDDAGLEIDDGDAVEPTVFDSSIPTLDRIAAMLYGASWYYDTTGNVEQALDALPAAFDQAGASGDPQGAEALIKQRLDAALDAAASSLDLTDADGAALLREAMDAIASNQFGEAQQLVAQVVEWYPGGHPAFPDGTEE